MSQQLTLKCSRTFSSTRKKQELEWTSKSKSALRCQTFLTATDLDMKPEVVIKETVDQATEVAVADIAEVVAVDTVVVADTEVEVAVEAVEAVVEEVAVVIVEAVAMEADDNLKSL